MLIAWNGAMKRMEMAYLFHSSNMTIDQDTWFFDGIKWTRASVPESLPPLAGSWPLMVYDTVRDREVFMLLGNWTTPGDAQCPTGVWEWDGSRWSHMATKHTPPWWTTQWVSAAFSPDLHATVMIDSATDSAPTWLYDGKDWRAINTRHRPTPSPSVLSYDPVRHAILALTLFDFKTWRFDGRDWSRLARPGAVDPSRLASGAPRQSPEVVFDPTRSRWVVFGGFDDFDNSSAADTWTGIGGAWWKVSPPVSPVAREAGVGRPSLAWDPSEERVLMFGGEHSLSSASFCCHRYGDFLDLGDTWMWDGTSWQEIHRPVYRQIV